MILQVHSKDLSAINGFDIEDVAGDMDRFIQFTWNEFNRIMVYL